MSDQAEAPSAIRTAKGEGIESKSKPKHTSNSFSYPSPHWKGLQKTNPLRCPWTQKRSQQIQKDQGSWCQIRLQVKSFLQVQIQAQTIQDWNDAKKPGQKQKVQSRRRHQGPLNPTEA